MKFTRRVKKKSVAITKKFVVYVILNVCTKVQLPAFFQTHIHTLVHTQHKTISPNSKDLLASMFVGFDQWNNSFPKTSLSFSRQVLRNDWQDFSEILFHLSVANTATHTRSPYDTSHSKTHWSVAIPRELSQTFDPGSSFCSSFPRFHSSTLVSKRALR